MTYLKTDTKTKNDKNDVKCSVVIIEFKELPKDCLHKYLRIS